MFDQKKILTAYITQDYIRIAWVILNNSATIQGQMQTEWDWSEETWIDIFKQIKTHYQTNHVRIVIADQYSFMTTMDIPKDVGDERGVVADHIRINIPGQLADGDWDFREVSQTAQARQVQVFAPVSALWQPLIAAIKNTGFRIEAMEPEMIAKERHPDAMIGIALKEDLQGSDAEVLNISTQRVHTIDLEDHNAPKKLGTILLIAIPILIVLVLLGAFFYPTFFQAEPAETLVPSSTPVATPTTASPSAILVKADLAQYNLNILNGSGISGKALEVKKKLEGIGFDTIETGNADSYNYLVTEIQAQDEVPDNVLMTIKKALEKDKFDVVIKKESLTRQNYDIVIILGNVEKEKI